LLKRYTAKREQIYAAKIDKKKEEAKEVEQQIESLIRSAIAASNKASENLPIPALQSSSKLFTPEQP